MIPVLIISAILVLLLFYGIRVYNLLVAYRMECNNSFAQVDVELKRRHELIPNLVETVKGVMEFEKETLTQVMEARSKAMGAGSDPGEMNKRLKAENEITQGLGRLMAVWENYPDLKASQNATQLQEELVSTENRIAYSRGHLNDVTSNYNTLIQSFPSNLIASSCRFSEREFLKISEAEREAPKVKF